MGNGRRMSIGIQDIPFNNVTGKRFSGGQVEKAITRIHIVDPAAMKRTVGSGRFLRRRIGEHQHPGTQSRVND